MGEVKGKGLRAPGTDGEADCDSLVGGEEVAQIVDEDLVEGEVCRRGVDGGFVVETDGEGCRGVGLYGEGGVGVDGEGDAVREGCDAFDLKESLLRGAVGGGVVVGGSGDEEAGGLCAAAVGVVDEAPGLSLEWKWGGCVGEIEGQDTSCNGSLVHC